MCERSNSTDKKMSEEGRINASGATAETSTAQGSPREENTHLQPHTGRGQCPKKG